jgi:hypothetical protein
MDGKLSVPDNLVGFFAPVNEISAALEGITKFVAEIHGCVADVGNDEFSQQFRETLDVPMDSITAIISGLGKTVGNTADLGTKVVPRVFDNSDATATHIASGIRP